MEQEIKDISKFHAKIGGMSCSFCVETIKKAYGKQEGVEKVNVSLSHEEALITYNPSKISKGAIEKTLTDLGYTIRDPRRVKAFEEQEEELRLAKKHLLIAGTFTLISLIFMILMWSGIRLWWFRWPMLSLALATMFGPGWYIKKKAWQSLKRGILNQHTLLEFGAFSGLGGGFMGFFIRSFPLADFFAVSVFVTSYHILGGWVSLLVRTRASQAVQKLLDLQPKTANVIQNGKEIVKEIEELKINDLVRVRPGERIPIDGITIKGYTTVDESVVTGESIPVEKNTGDAVIGGSINLSGSIEIKVNKVGEETFLQQVIKRVEEARALKPSILIIVDKLLQYYVPGVLIIAASAFLFWTVGSFFLFDAWNTTRAIFAALAVLVMGYPCALGMAMPLALIRGGGKAAEKGILMRSGEAFQAFPQIKKIVLDKTGTITKGKPEVVEIVNYDLNKKKILSLVGSAEMLSEHPLAQAIIKYIDEEKVSCREPKEFSSFSGRGVKAKVGKDTIIVGKTSFLKEAGISFSKHQLSKIEEMSKEGKTVVAIGAGKKFIGFIGLADTVKEDVAGAIEEMKRNNIEPIMITGDNKNTAEAIAKEVGIRKFYAEVLPGEKAEKIRKLEKDGTKVAMVGDGINDAPALMQADVGVAIGGGTDIAIESSDIIITGQNLTKVTDSYHLAKESYAKTKQNLALAFMFNGLGVPAAATGLLHPVWAMIAMAASVTAVLLNSFGIAIISRGRQKITSKRRTFQVLVPGMTCEGCKKTILTALEAINGVRSPQVNLSTKTVSFKYDPRVCGIHKIERFLKKGYGQIYVITTE